MVAKNNKNSYFILARTLVFVFFVMTAIGCSNGSDTTPTEGELAEADLFDGLKQDAEVDSTEDPYEDLAVSESSKSYADDNIVVGSAANDEDESGSFEKNSEFDYYYRALGGETVRHIAYALYSKGSAAKKLLSLNSGLNAAVPVPSDTKVYFDMETVSPRAELLTKDLLDRYGSKLSERLRLKRSQQFGNEEYAQVEVQRGDTLQTISERIFGTTRLWTELYLLNQDTIKNYDQLRVGSVLRYYPKTDYIPPVTVAKKDSQSNPSVSEESFYEDESEFQEPVVEESPAPVAKKPAPKPVTKPVVAAKPSPKANPGMDVDVTEEVGEDDPFADIPKEPVEPVAQKPAPEPKPVAVAKPVEKPAGVQGGAVRGGIPVDTKAEKVKTGLEKNEAAVGGTVAAKQNPPPTNRFRPNPVQQQRPKLLRPAPKKAESDAGFFGQTNIRRFLYLGLILFILVGGYFLTRPSRGFKKSKFGGIQPMPTPRSAPQSKPRAAPMPRNRGAGPPSPRPNQRTGTGS